MINIITFGNRIAAINLQTYKSNKRIYNIFFVYYEKNHNIMKFVFARKWTLQITEFMDEWILK